jgi:hypothetical protein
MAQNFPLRVLAGREIRSGSLPLFDPYTWSGAALLSGWNAGAAYPLTWLFAVLPATAAWTAGLITTWAVAGTSMFAFLRSLRLGSLAGLVGAVSFALGGAMAAQVAHFGLVAGMSWVPLALLAVLRLSRARPPRARILRAWSWRCLLTWTEGLPWTGVFAVSVALMILAGEPRAIVDGAVLVGSYAVWQVARLGRRALPAAAAISGGALLGVCLAAVQWLPGLAAISTSQRGDGSMALFSSGSLPDRWLLLTLVPDLLGGSGSLTQPGFFAGYNLTEVTSYVGVLPLVAAFAMLARIRRDGGSGGRWRPPEWLIWHVLSATGIVLALGGNSPLAAVLYRLPLFGSQRLQSRNIVVLDLALAVLLAYWADKPFPATARSAARAGAHTAARAGAAARGRLRRACWQAGRTVRSAGTAETFLGLLPPVGVIAVVALGIGWGTGLLHWLGIGGTTAANVIGGLRPWLIPSGVIAAGAIVFVLAGRRMGPRARNVACASLAAADLLVFTVLSVVTVAHTSPPAPAAASGAGAGSGSRAGSQATAAIVRPSPTRPLSALGYQGRFAIYDPGNYDYLDLNILGAPNLNDLSADGMPSVQGYTSIVDGRYASVTGSHQATGEGQDALSPAAIGNSTLDTLDTSILLTVPGYLVTQAGSGGAGAPAAEPSGTGERNVAGGTSTEWYLGESVVTSRIDVPDADAIQDAAAGTSIGLVTPGGPTRWIRARAVSSSLLQASVDQAVTADAVTARLSTTRAGRAGARTPTAARAYSVLGPPSVTARGGQVLAADGQLQNDLLSPHWGLAGYDGPFAVFTDRDADSPLSVQALPGRSSSGASVRYTTSVPGDVTSATVSSSRGLRLVRSVADIPGWSASWQPAHGRPTTLSVQPDGIVQAVDVPPGRGTVSWRYVPPRFVSGLATSLIAAALVLALAVAGRRARRTALSRGDSHDAAAREPVASLAAPGRDA